MAQPAITAGEKALPHNLEAERSILGAILIRNDAFNVAAELIKTPTTSTVHAHRRVSSTRWSTSTSGVRPSIWSRCGTS